MNDNNIHDSVHCSAGAGEDCKPSRKVIKRLAVRRQGGKELVLHEIIVVNFVDKIGTPDAGQEEYFGTLDDGNAYELGKPLVTCSNGHLTQQDSFIQCSRCKAKLCSAPGCYEATCWGIKCPKCGKAF